MPTSRPDRTAVLLRGTLNIHGKSVTVRIRDLSAGGAKISASVAMSLGDPAVLVIGSHALAGVIAWSSDDLHGLRFDEPADVDALRSRHGGPTATTFGANASSGWLAERKDAYEGLSQDTRRGPVRRPSM